MNRLRTSLRAALGNSRGYTILDVIVGFTIMWFLGLIILAALTFTTGIAEPDVAGLTTYFIAFIIVVTASGLGYYEYALRKKSAAARATATDPEP